LKGTFTIPARVVVVHDEPSFLEPLVTSLTAVGVDVAGFADSLLAWDALQFSGGVEILVTRVQFQPGRPHGVTLAKWVRERSPTVRILFVALPEFQPDIGNVGVLLPRPVSVPQVAETVCRMLSNEWLGRGDDPTDALRG
jgi:hypothetical protein